MDIFRTLHPDPVTHPGNTWSPLFRTTPQDRIDRLYYLSNRETPRLKPVRVTLYPETLEADEIPTPQRSYPSDHAAILFEFEWGHTND